MNLEIPWLFWLLFIIGVAGLAFLSQHLISSTPQAGTEPIDQAPTPVRATGTPPNRERLYEAAIQLVVHTDNSSWTRMYNFLTANSILMLAWATIFATIQGNGQNIPPKASVLSAISLFGLVLSIAWAPFCSRGRKLHRHYVHVARTLERNLENGSQEEVNDGPLSTDVRLRFLRWEQLFRTERLAVWMPIGFAVMFYFACLKS